MITFFESKPKINSNNFKPEILFSVLSLMFYHIFLKHNGELRIKIFEFLILISLLNVMKHFNHSDVYDGMKISNCARVSIKPGRATRSKRQIVILSKNQW